MSCVRLFFFFYIFNINSLSDKWFANIFFHSLGHLFILFMISFAVQKFFGLMKSHFFTLSSVDETKKNPLTRPVSRSLPSVSLSRSCMVSDLMFKVYPFWVDFLMYDVQFHSFHITSLPSFPNIINWKDYPVLIVHSCLLCHKSIGHISMGLFLGSLLCSIWASLVAQLVKNPPAMWDTWVRSLGWEDPLEKAMATHSQPTPVFWPGEFHGLCSP